MQIFKCFLIFIMIFNSAMAQRCDQQLIENLKSAMQDNLTDSENFQKMINQRAELALIKSSLVFFKLQENVKGNKEYLKQLEQELEKHHQSNYFYNRPSSWAMIRYLKDKLELSSFQQPYTEEEVKEITDELERQRLMGEHGIIDDIVLATKLQEETSFPVEKLSEQMYMRALQAPSYILYPDDKSKQLNTTDVYFLRKALKTDNKGNPTLLDFTLNQMKKHFSERNFPVNDTKAMEAAKIKSVKQFKETIAKELAANIPRVLTTLDERCKDELRPLLSEANAKCAAAIIIENNFDQFDKILAKLSEDPEVQGVFLHVAGAKSDFKCELEELPDGKFKLHFDTNLTNFEGINKSLWNLDIGNHKFPIQNKEGRVSFQFMDSLTFDDADSVPKTAKFSHNEQINARLDIKIGDSSSHTNEVDLTKCMGHPAGPKPPVPVLEDQTPEEEVPAEQVTEEPQKEEKEEPTPTVAKPEEEEKPKEEEHNFNLEIEKEIGNKAIKLKIKKHDKYECKFATCKAESMKEGKEGCKFIKEQEHTFQRKVDKPYNVYFQCREKDKEGAEFEAYRNSKGKEVKQYIGECEHVECFSIPNDDYKAPVIPPLPPQSAPVNIPIPDMPILLEG